MTALWGVLCAAQIAVSGLLLIRVGLGPSVCDRIVALNMMSTQLTIALIGYAVLADRSFYCDAALWLASFSYLGALVWARYLERRLL